MINIRNVIRIRNTEWKIMSLKISQFTKKVTDDEDLHQDFLENGDEEEDLDLEAYSAKRRDGTKRHDEDDEVQNTAETLIQVT